MYLHLPGFFNQTIHQGSATLQFLSLTHTHTHTLHQTITPDLANGYCVAFPIIFKPPEGYHSVGPYSYKKRHFKKPRLYSNSLNYWFAASQEIPRISRNPTVHYRTHNRPPPVSILGQPNPVHIPTSHLLEIHPNIIHPSSPSSPQWSLSLRFPHQDPIHPPLLTHARHMSSPYSNSLTFNPVVDSSPAPGCPCDCILYSDSLPNICTP